MFFSTLPVLWILACLPVRCKAFTIQKNYPAKCSHLKCKEFHQVVETPMDDPTKILAKSPSNFSVCWNSNCLESSRLEIHFNYSECSTECAGGVTVVTPLCFDKVLDVYVDDVNCKFKKSNFYLPCNRQPCHAKYEFNSCSANCGPGIEYVECRILITNDPPVILTVDDSYCAGIRPNHRPCFIQACQPNWFTTPWSPCSEECGRGMKYRDVSCMQLMENHEKVLRSQSCMQKQKPPVQSVCNTFDCPPSLSYEPWRKCSARDHGVQRRTVTCSVRGGDGKIRPSQECEIPDVIRTCHHPNNEEKFTVAKANSSIIYHSGITYVREGASVTLKCFQDEKRAFVTWKLDGIPAEKIAGVRIKDEARLYIKKFRGSLHIGKYICRYYSHDSNESKIFTLLQNYVSIPADGIDLVPKFRWKVGNWSKCKMDSILRRSVTCVKLRKFNNWIPVNERKCAELPMPVKTKHCYLWKVKTVPCHQRGRHCIDVKKVSLPSVYKCTTRKNEDLVPGFCSPRRQPPTKLFHCTLQNRCPGALFNTPESHCYALCGRKGLATFVFYHGVHGNGKITHYKSLMYPVKVPKDYTSCTLSCQEGCIDNVPWCEHLKPYCTDDAVKATCCETCR